MFSYTNSGIFATQIHCTIFIILYQTFHIIYSTMITKQHMKSCQNLLPCNSRWRVNKLDIYWEITSLINWYLAWSNCTYRLGQNRWDTSDCCQLFSKLLICTHIQYIKTLSGKLLFEIFPLVIIYYLIK